MMSLWQGLISKDRNASTSLKGNSSEFLPTTFAKRSKNSHGFPHGFPMISFLASWQMFHPNIYNNGEICLDILQVLFPPQSTLSGWDVWDVVMPCWLVLGFKQIGNTRRLRSIKQFKLKLDFQQGIQKKMMQPRFAVCFSVCLFVCFFVCRPVSWLFFTISPCRLAVPISQGLWSKHLSLSGHETHHNQASGQQNDDI